MHWTNYEITISDLNSDRTVPADSNDQFFLGQSLMWSNPNRAVELLEPVHESQPSSGVVSMIYAEALGHAA